MTSTGDYKRKRASAYRETEWFQAGRKLGLQHKKAGLRPAGDIQLHDAADASFGIGYGARLTFVAGYEFAFHRMAGGRA